jgi:small subunit ribosomal protein S7
MNMPDDVTNINPATVIDTGKNDAVKEQKKRTSKKVLKSEKSSEVVSDTSTSENTTAIHNSQKYSSKTQLLFGKYSYNDVVIGDESFTNYINLVNVNYPNIYGRRSNMSYYNSHISVVERLINKLMRGGTGKKIGGRVIRTKGRLQGKKMKLMNIVKRSFDIIYKNTGQNPIQVLIFAIENAAPVEDTTRVRYGGIIYNVAVDISASRRLNIALKNMALAAITSAFKNRKTLEEAIASEIIATANKDPSSYAIKKRIEIERIARSAR